MLIPKPKPGPSGSTQGPPTPWRLLGMGLELGLIIGGLTYLGYLGDKRWGTDPWLALTGALLSTIGGCYNLLKEAAKMPTPGSSPGNTPGSSGKKTGSSMNAFRKTPGRSSGQSNKTDKTAGSNTDPKPSAHDAPPPRP